MKRKKINIKIKAPEVVRKTDLVEAGPDFDLFATLSQLTTGEGRVAVSYVLCSDQTVRARARAKLNVCISAFDLFLTRIAIQS